MYYHNDTSHVYINAIVLTENNNQSHLSLYNADLCALNQYQKILEKNPAARDEFFKTVTVYIDNLLNHQSISYLPYISKIRFYCRKTSPALQNAIINRTPYKNFNPDNNVKDNELRSWLFIDIPTPYWRFKILLPSATCTMTISLLFNWFFSIEFYNPIKAFLPLTWIENGEIPSACNFTICTPVKSNEQ